MRNCADAGEPLRQRIWVGRLSKTFGDGWTCFPNHKQIVLQKMESDTELSETAVAFQPKAVPSLGPPGTVAVAASDPLIS